MGAKEFNRLTGIAREINKAIHHIFGEKPGLYASAIPQQARVTDEKYNAIPVTILYLGEVPGSHDLHHWKAIDSALTTRTLYEGNSVDRLIAAVIRHIITFRLSAEPQPEPKILPQTITLSPEQVVEAMVNYLNVIVPEQSFNAEQIKKVEPLMLLQGWSMLVHFKQPEQKG